MLYIKNKTEHGLTLNETFIIKDSQKAAIIRVALEEYEKKLNRNKELLQLTREIIDIIDLDNADERIVDLLSIPEEEFMV